MTAPNDKARFAPINSSVPQAEPPLLARADRWYKCGGTSGEYRPDEYVPQPAVYFSDEPRTASLSVDVLVAVSTSNGDNFFVTGWYSYFTKRWQFYGFVDDQTDRATGLTAHYWHYLPDAPDGFDFDPYRVENDEESDGD